MIGRLGQVVKAASPLPPAVVFRSTKLRWIRLKQLLLKGIESCSNGIPKPVTDALGEGREAFVVFCASRTDEHGRCINNVNLGGRALLAVRVRFIFSLGDCEGETERARECQELLDANRLSQAPHDKVPLAYKYNSFMALDLPGEAEGGAGPWPRASWQARTPSAESCWMVLPC